MALSYQLFYETIKKETLKKYIELCIINYVIFSIIVRFIELRYL